MKKFLLSIFAVMLAVFSVQAEEKTGTITFKTSGSDSSNAATKDNFVTGQVANNGGFTLSCTATSYCYTGKSGLKMSSSKANGSFTLGLGGTYNVKSITVNALRWKSTEAATIKVNSSSAKSLTAAAADYVFEVNSEISQIKLDVTKRVYVSSITVVYEVAGGGEGGDVAEKVATPVINPAGGQITADTEITITCATEGAQIYYTTDETTPTTESTLYNGAFKLTAAATVKAIAVADDLDNSAVATAEFTFPVVCENIAAFIENADKENNATISGEVVVVAQSGKYLFVQDNSAKIIVYGELGKEYKAGDRLTGIKGKYSPYNGLVEMVPDTESFGEATPGEAVEPVEITLNELGTTDLLTYVTISDVNVPAGSGKSYTVTDATGTATMYNTLGIEVPAGVGTITGFVSVFNTTRQLMPLEIVMVSAAPAAPTLTAECEFEEKMTVEITNVAEGATAYYSLNNDTDWVEGTSVEITGTTTVYAKVVKDGVSSEVVSAKYTKNEPVTPPAEGEATEVVDVLNREFTGIKNGATSYASWSDKTATSAAVYAGNSAGSNDAIQLRSNNSNSGIVTTVSGGKAKKIVVTWNSKTAVERELWVYGSNTAYTNPTDLYKTATDGDKLAEILYGTTEFVIEGDYKYIGLRSGSGAMYIDEIQITWAVEATESYTLTVGDAGYATLFLDFAATIPAFEGEYGVFAAKVNGNYVDLKKVEGVLPANTGVIVKAAPGEYTFTYTDKEATVDTDLMGTATAEYITPAGTAYVLGKLDDEVALYKAKLTDGKFLNNANKAYLVVANANPAAQYSFRFGEGTTGIENVESAEAVKAIFDLTGRRVEAITAPGIYIVNGKKVLVK